MPKEELPGYLSKGRGLRVWGSVRSFLTSPTNREMLYDLNGDRYCPV